MTSRSFQFSTHASSSWRYSRVALFAVFAIWVSAWDCGLPPAAFAQGKAASAIDGAIDRIDDRTDDRAKDHAAVTHSNRDGERNLEARDRWMMRGRAAKRGRSPAALRLQAQQQKLAMRVARQKLMGKGAEAANIEQPGATKLATNTNAAKSSLQTNNLLERPATSSGWVPLGPAPLISDQSAYGAAAGRVTAVAVDPSDATGNTVYAAAAAGGVWQSTNAASQTAGNVTWTALTDQQATLVNGAVSVKPDGSVVLVGTGEPNSAIDSYYGVGILRSTNAGTSWTLIPTATGNNPALSFAGLGFGKFAWSRNDRGGSHGNHDFRVRRRRNHRLDKQRSLFFR
jgi:hypothetical protein